MLEAGGHAGFCQDDAAADGQLLLGNQTFPFTPEEAAAYRAWRSESGWGTPVLLGLAGVAPAVFFPGVRWLAFVALAPVWGATYWYWRPRAAQRLAAKVAAKLGSGAPLDQAAQRTRPCTGRW